MQSSIVSFLRKSDHYISGEDISRRLNMSRAAVWKHVQDLRGRGYDIVAVPHLGYKLMQAPDKLLPEEIQEDLKTKVLGRRIVYFDSVGSTMEEAFRLGMAGEPEGTVICAEHQTKGKGRQGRHWSSPRGKGIYLSMLLRPVMPPSEISRLTLLTAVSVCEAVAVQAGLSCRIKWPNDVFVNGRKLAGILTEMNAEIDRVRFVVVGIGINVNTPLTALPKQATSIRHETQKKGSRLDLLRAILVSFEKWYDLLPERGFGPVIARWKELSMTLGTRVRIVDVGGTVEGQAVDLDEHGALIIQNKDGRFIKRMSGDVEQVADNR